MRETEATGRVRIVVRVAIVWAMVIVAKLAYLQIWQHRDFVRIAEIQQHKSMEIQGPRGDIFDRNGTRMAKSMPVDSVCVNPLRVPDAVVAAELLSPVLGLDPLKVYTEIHTAAEKKAGFLWIKRRISGEESQRIRSMKLDWIEFRTESRRVYPNGTLAAHILGSVDREEHGNGGIELAFEKELAGIAARVRMSTDSRSTAYAEEYITQPQAGVDLYTTIDLRIQNIAEQALAEAVERSGAKSGSIVVTDPKTGDVLALANYPTYDPNETSFDPLDPRRNNLAITSPYEPGSVFKLVTLSAALETTRLTPDSIVFCGNGILRLGSRVIHEAHGGYGSLSMAEVLAKSSNIGAIQIGLTVGQANMIEYVKRLGFGARTGLGLRGEHPGKVRRKWGSTSLASVAMGHEIMVTAMQLGQLSTVMASGGMMVRPRLVVSKRRPGEQPVSIPVAQPERVLRPETAVKMRQMMEGVVLHGTARGKANLKGYTSGGKTGTAQIYDFKTHQYTHFYNGSFVGFAPINNPAVAIVVTINHTSGAAGYGGSVAAPVFHDVATAALRFLDVQKDLPEVDTSAPKGKSDSNDLAITALDPEAEEELAANEPEDAIPGLSAADQKMVNVARAVNGPKVPNFQGKTMREVAEDAASRGIQIETMGTGIARLQMPPAGAVLPPGEKVRVQFIR